MQYSPKLKKAMAEIKAILQREDIEGFVVLHDNIFSEFLNHLESKNSIAKVTDEGIRFRLKTAEVGTTRAHEMAKHTYNLMSHFADVVGRHALAYIDGFELLKKTFDGEEKPGTFTSQTEIDN